jgi:hypothetical protein
LFNYYIASRKLLPLNEYESKRIIALRLMLSVAVIIGFASCSKQVQKVRQELLAGMSIVKKLLVIKNK